MPVVPYTNRLHACQLTIERLGDGVGQRRQVGLRDVSGEDWSACIIVSCTRSSASDRLRSNHIASRNSRSTCGRASASKAAHAWSSAADPGFRPITIRLRRLDGEDVAQEAFYSQGISRPHGDIGATENRRPFMPHAFSAYRMIVAFGLGLL